jgi:hypothetical protein
MAAVAAPAGRQAAWKDLARLGERARDDRAGALAALQELFASGRPSYGLDGKTEGLVVAFTLHPALDRAAALLGALWMPWSGKRFDAPAGRGENLLLGDRFSGFGFRTRVEPSRVDRGVDVLVIDYAAVARNPRPVRQIRDELVEIAPGVHLGKALWRRRGGGHALVAYWALREPG